MLAMREVRAIYHQGVYAVAAAFRQLYEMVEVEDERVQKRVAAATAAHLRKSDAAERVCGRVDRGGADHQGGTAAGVGSDRGG
jgi:hypothetical protein